MVVLVCNDIPLDSKEVPITAKEGKRMASCHTWTCKKMKNAIFFVAGPVVVVVLLFYFIFDVATKRIPLKGCFYVPDVLLQ